MPRDRVSRVLDEFSAVTSAAPRPVSPARSMNVRNRLPVATLTGATLVIVAVAVAAIVLGRPGPAPIVGSSPSTPAATPTATQAATPAPSAPPSVTAVASASPVVASAKPTTGPCDADFLNARITSWEGAAGSRIASVKLTNAGPTSCLVDTLDRPQLVGGDGSVRIDGKNPTTTDRLRLAPGAVVTTLVEASNDCKPAAVPPISVAFVQADGQRIVALPVSGTDTTDPPCNGAGSPGTIDMHPWAP
jgi:hypothetical protein